MDVKSKYLENVNLYKDRIDLQECTTTAFFTLLLQRIGILFHHFTGIFWDKGWKLRFIIIVAQIRALCDKTIDLLIDDKIEHPANTVIKVLGESNIDVDDVIIEHGTSEMDREIELVTADEASKARLEQGKQDESPVESKTKKRKSVPA